MLKKRVLWVLNHDTLSKFELPLIQDLGFEIFTPKIVPIDILKRSGSVTFEYDKMLSIPEQDLELLNAYNFYENEKMPFVIRNIMNKYFDIAIIMFDFYALDKIIDNFDGFIFARAFGLGKTFNYTNITKDVFGEEYFYKLEQLRERFWFSHCYENIPDIENGIYQEKAVYMPLGLPDDFYTVEDQWVGISDKVLFFCTRIKYNSESEEVYKKFKRDFKGFDYIIAGNQPEPVNDERVIGFLEREDLNNLFRECKVMYYDSTFPRHLHYHPLEAMIVGIPLVYMEGGALSILGGENQAGCCKDIKEVRNKVKRILNGDVELINAIKTDQKNILNKFSYEYNKTIWEKNFLPLVNGTNQMKNSSIKKIAVFISQKQPQYYLNDYTTVIDLLNNGIKQINTSNSIILNVPIKEFNIEIEFSNLIKSAVSVREYSLETITFKNTSDTLALMFKHTPLWYSEYTIPMDYAHNYIEADYWLFWFDNIDSPIAPLKPYGIYVENLSDRYYNTISNINITNYKNALFIITSFENTKNDLIKHLGIVEEKILIIPSVLPTTNKYKISHLKLKNDYNLIEVDLMKYNNIIDILNEISDYYSLYKAEEKIKIHINNYLKDKDSHNVIIKKLNKYISKSINLKKNISIYTDLRSNDYDILYAHAKKIIIPHNVENLFYKLIKAVSYSKSVVLDDLPIYKEYEKNIGGQFEYKKFTGHKNVMIDVLTENFDFNPSSLELSRCSIEDVSQMWRKLL